jgi:hypothetical protein
VYLAVRLTQGGHQPASPGHCGEAGALPVRSDRRDRGPAPRAAVRRGPDRGTDRVGAAGAALLADRGPRHAVAPRGHRADQRPGGARQPAVGPGDRAGRRERARRRRRARCPVPAARAPCRRRRRNQQDDPPPPYRCHLCTVPAPTRTARPAAGRPSRRWRSDRADRPGSSCPGRQESAEARFDVRRRPFVGHRRLLRPSP